MKPIYKPKGRALEYCELAIDIYIGCPHSCTYCYARTMAERFGKPWTGEAHPRPGIVDALKQQLDKGYVSHAVPYIDETGKKRTKTERIPLGGKLIQLCFHCDPYPMGFDSTVTREIIKLIKESGNNIQILTKGGRAAERDFDLLDRNDWFGVTYAGYCDSQRKLSFGWCFQPVPEEPNASSCSERLVSLERAYKSGIKTWVSCEPVIVADDIYNLIEYAGYIDLYRIGKLNYHPSDIDWGAFGRECERLCKLHGKNYYLKEDLREEMGKQEACM